MSDELLLTGMVLSSFSSGEYDRRVVILTRERGKITAFARGAQKPTRRLLAATNPFVFGRFTLYEGRNAYTLVQAEVREYFRDVQEDFEATCYGIYFLEVADYYSRENLDAADLLNLLYISLKALMRPAPPRKLVRALFELKALQLEGEYPFETAENPSLKEATRYAVSVALYSDLKNLYGFTLENEALEEFCKVQKRLIQSASGGRFKSEEMLEFLISGAYNGQESLGIQERNI